MSENVLLAAVFFPALAAVFIFFLKYLSAVLQARVRLAQDEAYREIAAKAIDAQTETAQILSSLSSTLIEVQSRLARLEKILKEVE